MKKLQIIKIKHKHFIPILFDKTKNSEIFYQTSAGKPRPSGLGCRGKKSDCLIYYTIIILKISKFGDFH